MLVKDKFNLFRDVSIVLAVVPTCRAHKMDTSYDKQPYRVEEKRPNRHPKLVIRGFEILR